MKQVPDAHTLMRAAQSAAGSSDWGDFDPSRNLQVLLDQIAHSPIAAAGLERLLKRIHMLLCNRLGMAAARRRDPTIAAGRIERPIIILGLPRSGTSNLLSLLAADPAHRVPRMWEIYRPCPPPLADTYDSDPRIGEVQDFLASEGFAGNKALQAAHPFDARLPEECGFIWEHMFCTMTFGAFLDMPGYNDWVLNRADWDEVYRFHHQFLQHLQCAYGADRWVLKTPEHGQHVPELVAAYPDAILLFTHRDPAKVVPSLTSNIIELRKLWAGVESVDPRTVAEFVLELQAEGVRRTMAARRDPAVDRLFYDIDFFDLTERPLETMERMYSHFGLPFTDAAREGIRGYVDNEARKLHGHGGHAYSLADYGYAPAEIDAAFGEYIAHYHVPLTR
ncbi:MAG: sulfotransferase [Gammaproteobacteria bacterium]